MDKNGKVEIFPISESYRKGYEKIRWARDTVEVKIYDPFLDGPIDALLPEPVSMKVEGGGFPAEALTITFPMEG